MKMHDSKSKGWRIGTDVDSDPDGSSRAMVTVFEPGMRAQDHRGVTLGRIFTGSTAEEAEAKAVAAADEWIERQLPRKKGE
jgi:hypothetical protein